MERLTEHCCPGGIRIKGCSALYSAKERKGAPASNAIVRLAAYEDAMPLDRAQELAQAEKDGRLVVLPCKEGSIVYAITSPVNVYELESVEAVDIFECTVESVTFYSNGNTQFRLYYHGVFVASFVTVHDFGKTVFLTREEAEAALKKREAEEIDAR